LVVADSGGKRDVPRKGGGKEEIIISSRGMKGMGPGAKKRGRGSFHQEKNGRGMVRLFALKLVHNRRSKGEDKKGNSATIK